LRISRFALSERIRSVQFIGSTEDYAVNLKPPRGKMKMKLIYLMIALLLSMMLVACEQKQTNTTEKVIDKVNDALDRRSDEKARDAIEDVSEAVEDASKELQKGIEDISKEIKK
jgi:hypothetical protein